jgi:glucan biosynthesis protein C
MSILPAPTARRFDLDWLRIMVFGLLIFYHVGMYYVPWSWHVKSVHQTDAITPLMVLTNPWRLSLLFLISGAATRFMLDKLDGPALARTRSLRLLVPLVCGMLVVVPPQTYYEVIEKFAFDGGWAEFYARYLTFYGGWCKAGQCLIVPTWNHLWFVAYLWAYTMLVALLRPVLFSARVQQAGGALERLLDGPGLILLPWLLLGGLRVLLQPIFGQTHALADDWYLHAIYFSVFLFGFLAAKSERLWRRIEALRWPALALGIAAWLCLAAITVSYGTQGAAPEALRPAIRMVWALDQWCFCVALLGFAHRWLNRDAPARAYLTEAVFPYYIVHQTVIVVVGHNLSAYRLPAWLELAIIVASTALACFLSYEIVRRVPWLRPLFGLKPKDVPTRLPADGKRLLA